MNLFSISDGKTLAAARSSKTPVSITTFYYYETADDEFNKQSFLTMLARDKAGKVKMVEYSGLWKSETKDNKYFATVSANVTFNDNTQKACEFEAYRDTSYLQKNKWSYVMKVGVSAYKCFVSASQLPILENSEKKETVFAKKNDTEYNDAWQKEVKSVEEEIAKAKTTRGDTLKLKQIAVETAANAEQDAIQKADAAKQALETAKKTETFAKANKVNADAALKDAQATADTLYNNTVSKLNNTKTTLSKENEIAREEVEDMIVSTLKPMHIITIDDEQEIVTQLQLMSASVSFVNIDDAERERYRRLALGM